MTSKSKKDKIKQGNQKDFDLLYDVLVNGGTYSDYKSELQDRSMPQEQQNFDISEDNILAAWILGKDEESEQYAKGGRIHQGLNSNLYRQQFGGTWDNPNFNSGSTTSTTTSTTSSSSTGSSESIGFGGFDIGSGLSSIATPAGQLVDNTIVNWLDTGNYGDWKTDIQGESIDPLTRLAGNIGGAHTDNAIERLKAERLSNDPNFAIGDTASNLSQYYSYIKDRGPRKQEIQTRDWSARVMDNLNASGQGALQGAKFGPWGALIGGIIGGVANIPSQILEDQNRKKLNNEILKYNIGLDQGLKEFDTNLTNSYKMQLWNQLQQPYLNTYKCGGKMKNKLASGGYINSHYDYITDPLVKVNAGGTHQENPNEGVQTSIAPDGQPNLVEEGETIINNQDDAYVFSDRIVADDEILKSHLLPNKFAGKTYADISKELDKIIAEHKNDEISKRTFDEMISRLQQAQEDQKYQEKAEEVAKFIDGLSDEEKEQLEQTMVEEAKAEQQVAEEQAVAEQQAQEQAAQEQQMQPEQVPEQVAMEQPEEQIVPSRYDQMMSRAQITDAANQGLFGRGGHMHQDGNELDEVLVTAQNLFKPKYRPATLLTVNSDYPEYIPLFRNPQSPDDYQPIDITLPEGYLDWNSIVENNPQSKINEKDIVDSGMDWIDYASVKPSTISPTSNIPAEETTTVGSSSSGPQVVVGSRNYDGNKDLSTYLRYAPAIGSGLQALSDALGITNKNDYTNPNMFQRSINAIPNVGFVPIGGYRTPNYLDTLTASNISRSATEAARRAAINNSSGNASAALAALDAMNQQENNALGNLYIQAQQYNNQMEKEVALHNLRINQINASMSLSAQEKNQAIAAEKARLNYNLAQMRQQIENANDMAKSQNYTNLMTNLGNIGRENFIMNQVNSNMGLYYGVDRNGNAYYKSAYNDLSDEEKEVVDNYIKNEGLTIKKK